MSFFLRVSPTLREHSAGISVVPSHTQMLSKTEIRRKMRNELKLKIHHAGQNLRRLCMKNYLIGRPYTDYESDVLVLTMSGEVVGELNHSRKFPAAFRGSVCKVVNKEC